jgi:hypothetical protein
VAAKAKPSGVMRSPFLFPPATAFRQQPNIRGHIDTIGLWSDAAIPIVVLNAALRQPSSPASLKNVNSEHIVPLHPALKEEGFF